MPGASSGKRLKLRGSCTVPTSPNIIIIITSPKYYFSKVLLLLLILLLLLLLLLLLKTSHHVHVHTCTVTYTCGKSTILPCITPLSSAGMTNIVRSLFALLEFFHLSMPMLVLSFDWCVGMVHLMYIYPVRSSHLVC